MEIFSEFFFWVLVAFVLFFILPLMLRKTHTKGREMQQSSPATVPAVVNRPVAVAKSPRKRRISLGWILLILIFVFEVVLVGSGQAVEILTTDYTQGDQFENRANQAMVNCLSDSSQTVKSCRNLFVEILVNEPP